MDYIIAGLGNPESKYFNTRHNAGFLAIDTLSSEFNIDCKRFKFKSLSGEGKINGKKVLLLKPQTYMNNSGEAIVEAMQFYKLPIEKVIIIFDDYLFEPSFLRIRQKGSDGGHNGIKSIIALTGNDNFPRIKLGIGNKPHQSYDLADWVLSSFKKDELKLMEIAFKKSIDIVSLIVDGKIDEAMNKYNTKEI